MQRRFRDLLIGKGIIGLSDKIILAVSGGIDSMVMTDLFSSLENRFIVAHCNFGLRGKESDQEEKFVEVYCQERGLYYYSKKFDTEEYADEKRISIQMAARELRYKWFEDLRQETDYEFIATAHNLDDQVETFFINLGRGTGIRGLTGIPARSGVLIRPMIYFSRNEIMEYAREKGLEWRDDSSNASLKYLRNRIRHELIPLFRELNPSFERTMAVNLKNLNMAQNIYLKHINEKREILLDRDKDSFFINIEPLKNEEFSESVLYEILSDFNFNASTIGDIFQGLDASPGKRFYSETHRLIKDREQLIIEAKQDDQQERYYIETGQNIVTTPVNLTFKVVDAKNFRIPPYPDVACLDAEKVDFPLILRKWLPGDYFHPLGMQNSKKISDFYVDNKFSLHQKDNTWLLCSGQVILWIVGYRIDDRFKVQKNTRKILTVKYME